MVTADMLLLHGVLLALGAAPSALTICIDPGHPSEVGRGTQGRMVTEIHVAWEVAMRMKGILQKQGVTVVLTKHSENEFVKNRDRAETANNCRADLMVRLHCDAASGSGFTTYYPDRQGVTDGFTGPDPALIQRIAPIAKRFNGALKKDLEGFLKDNGNLSDIKTAVGSKHGALIGSIFSKVPVVLVEMCVLTNPHDEDLVRTSKGRQRLAEALADACVESLRNGRKQR